MITPESAPSAAPSIVALRGVGKTFGNGVVSLDGFDLSVRTGEFLTLLGPSGCGKSTALRIVAGLSGPAPGNGEWSGSPAGGPKTRPPIGLVFQAPTPTPLGEREGDPRPPLP